MIHLKQNRSSSNGKHVHRRKVGIFLGMVEKETEIANTEKSTGGGDIDHELPSICGRYDG